ncbi:MAG: hypothetical protein HYX75_13475 [Acidobacteria bacterium]|nr:hypothetical protein [Acidobacteriota bacterium]
MLAAIPLFLGLIAAMTAPALVPRVNPFKLGEVIGEFCFEVAAVVFLVTWLWLSKHRVLAVGVGGGVVILFLVGALLDQDGSRRATALFKQSVARGFTLVDAEGGRRLSQPGFGLTIETPGINYKELPVSYADPQTAIWVFQNAEEGRVLAVLATLRRFPDENSLRDYLHGIVSGARKSAETNGQQLNVLAESVKWRNNQGQGEAECSAGNTYYCVRVITSDSSETAARASYGAQAFAADLPTARAMVASLRIEARR